MRAGGAAYFLAFTVADANLGAVRLGPTGDLRVPVSFIGSPSDTGASSGRNPVCVSARIMLILSHIQDSRRPLCCHTSPNEGNGHSLVSLKICLGRFYRFAWQRRSFKIYSIAELCELGTLSDYLIPHELIPKRDRARYIE